MVDVESEGGVTRIFLNRPEKVNALDSAHLEDLLLAFRRLAGNPEVRVAVLGGRGKAFCGGADVRELRALNASNAGAFVQKIHAVCEAIGGLPVPVVARLHGAVIGAGLEIAAACDLRIAAEGTRFAMPEVRLGIPSVVEAALLPRLIGAGRARWLGMTGEAISAEKALAWGLVEKISSLKRLERETDQTLDLILEAGAEAMRAQKRLCKLWEEAPLAESVRASIDEFAASYESDEVRKRIDAFRRGRAKR